MFASLYKFFLLGSNKSSTSPGFLLQRKVIARLSLRLSLNLNTLRTIESIKDKKKGRTRKETKEEERTNKTKGKGNEINEMQNWIQNQMCFTSEFQRNNSGSNLVQNLAVFD